MNDSSMSDKADVILFPPLMYLLALAAGIIISYFFPFQILPRDRAAPIGAIILGAGIVFLVSGARILAKNNTTVNPSGISTTIVKESIFRFTRNPMYVSFTLINAGISIILQAWFGLFLLIPLLIIVQKGVIEREEKYLTRKFGAEYLDYKAKVRRWL